MSENKMEDKNLNKKQGREREELDHKEEAFNTLTAVCFT